MAFYLPTACRKLIRKEAVPLFMHTVKKGSFLMQNTDHPPSKKIYPPLLQALPVVSSAVIFA